MLQVPPADAQGRHSLGLAHEYLLAALATARVVIAEVNDQAPWTMGAAASGRRRASMPASRLRTRRCVHASPASGPVETAIAAHAASLIEDRATLQCGLGAFPEAVLAALHDRRDLGVHSGAVGDGVMALMEAGVVTNARKGRDRGATDRRRADGQHAPASLRAPQRGAADARHRLHPRPGRAGLAAALRRHQLGDRGRPERPGQRRGGGRMLCRRGRRRGRLPARRAPQPRRRADRRAARHAPARTAASSPRLSGPVSTPRCDAGVFVTEYGVADLRGLPLAARRRRMLDIAHPEHRARLEREAFAATAPLAGPTRLSGHRPFRNDAHATSRHRQPAAHAGRRLRRQPARRAGRRAGRHRRARRSSQRTGIDPARIDDVVFAQSYANSETPCIGRWVALQAGLADRGARHAARPPLRRRPAGHRHRRDDGADRRRRRRAGRRRREHEQRRVLHDRHALGQRAGSVDAARPARSRARTLAARSALRPHLAA